MRTNPLPVVFFLCLVAACGAYAQSPVDSSWALDHGDTLFFHHDGTSEYVRANGNREVRFPDQRRLYFFTPDHFISKSALLSHNFQETNGVPQPGRSDLRFRLAAGYSAPKIVWASFPGGEPAAVAPLTALRTREYRFKVPFDDVGWHVVEISANGPGQTVQIIARILVCVGDHLPLPFDTVVERRGPAMMPRTTERVGMFLGYDRTRSGASLMFDTTRTEAASVLVTAASLQKLRWALMPAAKARTILGPIAAQCDSLVSMIAIATAHTPEELAWSLWMSPTHRSLGILKKATGVSVGVTRLGHELLAAIVLLKSP